MHCYFYTPAMRYETMVEMKGVSSYSSDVMRLEDSSYFDLRKLHNTFKGFEFDTYYYDYDDDVKNELCGYIFGQILQFTNPQFDLSTKTVSYYESLEKREKEVRTTSKIGKYIRKVAPYFNDKQVEIMVDLILEKFKVPNYTYHFAKTSEEFGEVYRMKPERGSYIGDFSCLNASCMGDKFGSDHPCQAYGSGDFELHYILNEDGRIAARTILCTLDDTYAWIYASSTIAGKYLKTELEKRNNDAQSFEDAHRPWDGAKLLKIRTSCGYLAPYLDVCQSVDDVDDYFVVTYGSSDLEFSNTSGYTSAKCSCEECGSGQYEEDMYVIDGDYYCSDCCVYCNYTGEYVTGDSVQVYYGSSWYNFETWCEDAANDHAKFDEVTYKWYTESYYAEIMADRESDNEDETEEEEEQFEGFMIGDKVIITGNTSSSCNCVNDIGEIVEGLDDWCGNNNIWRVIVPGRYNSDTTDCWTRVNEMKVIKRKVSE